MSDAEHFVIRTTSRLCGSCLSPVFLPRFLPRCCRCRTPLDHNLQPNTAESNDHPKQTMKFTTAVLVAAVSTAVDAVKIDREGGDYDFQRDLRFTGKGKSSKDNVDNVCLSACAATCALPDCIPLDATAAPTKGKGGKGKNKFGMSGKGKGSSSEAPVSEKRLVFVSLFVANPPLSVTPFPRCQSRSSVVKLPVLHRPRVRVNLPVTSPVTPRAMLPVTPRAMHPVTYLLRRPVLRVSSSMTTPHARLWMPPQIPLPLLRLV